MITILSSEIYYLIFYKLDLFTDSVFQTIFILFFFHIKIKFESKKIHFINI